MSKLSQLNLVLELERKKEQTCAMQYQKANAHLQQNQTKLSGLERYRLDYLHTIRQKAQQGVEAQAMNQHQQFVGKLDKACEQQIQLINNAVLVTAQRKQQWLMQQQKTKAIKSLILSKQKKAIAQENRQEQKMFDEIASQHAFRKASLQR